MGQKKTKKAKGKRTVSSRVDHVYSTRIKEAFRELSDKGILRFAGLYLFYIGLLTLLYISFKDDLRFLNNSTAATLSALLDLLGVHTAVNEAVIYLNFIALEVIGECTGIYEIVVFSGCVLAYPASTGKKLAGIAFGIPVVLGFNMVRLISLAFVGLWFPSLFNYVHYYLWQVTLIIIVVFVMLIWIEKVVNK